MRTLQFGRVGKPAWVLASVIACIGCATPRAAEPAAASATTEPAGEPAALPAAGATTAQAPLIAIPNAAQPLPGVLTGGQPSEAQLREASSAGYKTIISLLPDSDTAAEAALAQQLGLRFVTIAVRGADDLTEANARALGEALSAPSAKPLILHCGSGNRAGALLALESFYVDHASAADALALGDRAGLKALRPVVEAKLQAASPANAQ